MARGDHLRVRRWTGYWHHGIDLGDDRVMHFSIERPRKNVAICISSRDAFCRGGEVEVVTYARAHPAELVVARALSRLGTRGYNPVTNNCEHFARWCKTGERSAATALRAVGSLAALGGLIGLGAAGIARLKPARRTALLGVLLGASVVLALRAPTGRAPAAAALSAGAGRARHEGDHSRGAGAPPRAPAPRAARAPMARATSSAQPER